MARSSAFTKRFTTGLPMEMYNTVDKLADMPEYASIPHVLRVMLRQGLKRSRRCWRLYQEECDKLDVPEHMR